MLDIFAKFATNEASEDAGVWVPFGDAKFLVARSGNRAYSKKLSADFSKNQMLLEAKDDTADKVSEGIMIGVFAETILLGWEGVSYKSAPMPYSKENAKILLAHKDFRRQVGVWADDINLYKSKEEAEQEKN